LTANLISETGLNEKEIQKMNFPGKGPDDLKRTEMAEDSFHSPE
jgi:hypothetical protein